MRHQIYDDLIEFYLRNIGRVDLTLHLTSGSMNTTEGFWHEGTPTVVGNLLDYYINQEATTLTETQRALCHRLVVDGWHLSLEELIMFASVIEAA
jgi:hypothetical protein